MELVTKGVNIIGASVQTRPSSRRTGQLDSVPVHLLSKGSGRYALGLTSTPASSSRSTDPFGSGGKYRPSEKGPPEEGGTVTISFYARRDEKSTGHVEVSIKKHGRRTRRRGWRKLEVTRDPLSANAGDGQGFVAYQLCGRRRSSTSEPETDTILIFSKPDTANFLAALPDETPLGDITLPGTHESCALYGFPFSQCQQPSTPILQQLLDGVRFLDVRLRVVGDELLMYHGPRPQRSSLTLLLQVLHGFLDAHPGETIILSIKEEIPPFNPHFSARVWAAFEPFASRWFLEERIPALGEVRGKGLLLTRFDRDKDGQGGWDRGMGIHPTRWPDSRMEGFDWDCAGTTVRTQDWYRVHTFLQIPEKLEAITSHLEPTLHPSSNAFTLSYTSASFFPLSLPTTIAKGFGFPTWGLGVEGINARLSRWLLWNIVDDRRARACVASDFYRQCAAGDGLAELLVLMNFLGDNEGG